MPVENLILLRQSPVPAIERGRYARELHQIGRAVGCNPLTLSVMIREWRVRGAKTGVQYRHSTSPRGTPGPRGLVLW